MERSYGAALRDVKPTASAAISRSCERLNFSADFFTNLATISTLFAQFLRSTFAGTRRGSVSRLTHFLALS